MSTTTTPHQCCACHSSTLIATKNAQNAELDSQFKKLNRSSSAKATAIWNKSSLSVQTAEAIMECYFEGFTLYIDIYLLYAI